MSRLRKGLTRLRTPKPAKASETRELIEAVNRLVAVIEQDRASREKPKSRTGYVDLPSGRVQMTVREH